uniref:Vacuolar protein sorting-associated protein 11 homolog n=1 Tax=Rhabditophanes sp. KR3021 TaxID=114890 RepID=A0AC35UCT9_9BILA
MEDLGWRRCQFFTEVQIDNVSPINSRNKQSPSPDKDEPIDVKMVVAKCNVICSRSTDDLVLFGESKGHIFILNKKRDVKHILAYSESLFYFDTVPLAAALLGKDIGDIPSIKLFSVSDLKSTSNKPSQILKCYQFEDDKIKPVIVAINETVSMVVVGYSDNSLMYFKGDMKKEKYIKWQVLCKGDVSFTKVKMTGLKITTVTHRPGIFVIYVITNVNVMGYVHDGTNCLNSFTYEDCEGAEPECWDFCYIKNELVIAGKDVVNFYFADDALDNTSGRCHALERGIEKVQILHVGEIIAILTKPSLSNYSLTLFDVDSKVSSYFVDQLEGARIFTLDRNVYLSKSNGEMICFHEKGISQKMEILLQKNLYDVAIHLATTKHLTNLPEIFIKYGSYLLEKGDYDSAVNQYIKAIGTLKPSSVIKQLLDSSNTKYLAKFLEALIEKGFANEYHCNLLINCYAKERKTGKLMSFLEKYKLPFLNIDGAVNTLKSSGFTKEAIKFAYKYEAYELVAQVIVESSKDYSLLIELLANKSVDVKTKKHIIKQYCMPIVTNIPLETEKFIKANLEKEDEELFFYILIAATYNPHLYESLIRFGMEERVYLEWKKVEKCIIEFYIQKCTENEKLYQHEAAEITNFDNTKAILNYAQIYHCAPVLMHLYIKGGEDENYLYACINAKDYKNAREHCRSKNNADIWGLFLLCLADADDISEEFVMDCLEEVSKNEKMHPLSVMEIMCKSKKRNLATIKIFLLKWLGSMQGKINKKYNETKSVKEKIRACHKKLEVTNENHLIITRIRCAACDLPLSVPLAHFIASYGPEKEDIKIF